MIYPGPEMASTRLCKFHRCARHGAKCSYLEHTSMLQRMVGIMTTTTYTSMSQTTHCGSVFSERVYRGQANARLILFWIKSCSVHPSRASTFGRNQNSTKQAGGTNHQCDIDVVVASVQSRTSFNNSKPLLTAGEAAQKLEEAESIVIAYLSDLTENE